jgi:hypothetical protein
MKRVRQLGIRRGLSIFGATGSGCFISLGLLASGLKSTAELEEYLVRSEERNFSSDTDVYP